MITPGKSITTARRVAAVVAALAAALALLAPALAGAAPAPNRFVLESHFGREVDVASGANVCAAEAQCRPGRESSEAGGFLYPYGVAVDNAPGSPDSGNVYVADTANHRVQELTPAGAFVSMFGWEVNETKDGLPAANQAEKNVCTAASKDVCKAGGSGAAPGQLGEAAASIAIDPLSGDVYLTEQFIGESGGESAVGQRVQKFTAAGKWVLEIGREVNEQTKGNLCTEQEVEKAGVKCMGPKLVPFGAASNSEPGAFNFEEGRGGLLAAGGPEDLLYVGDEGRVQKFKSSGEAAGEVSLEALSATGKVKALAVDPAGDLFLAETEAAGVYEYDASGQLQPTAIDPAATRVLGLAFDPGGHLAIVERKETPAGVKTFGFLYSPSGAKISEFGPPAGELQGFPTGLAFSSTHELYLAETNRQEIEAYDAIVFPETRTCPVQEITGTSANLCGEIDPDGIPASGFFQYGTTPALGSETAVVFHGAGEAFTPVSALTGLEPNQVYYYRVVAEAEVGGASLQGHGEEVEFHTPVIAPQVPGAPSATYVTAQTAVLSGLVNPEHTSTRYHFEYGACPTLTACASVQSTPDEESSEYGAIGTAEEIRGLEPQTTYRFRLSASNEYEGAGTTLGGSARGVEGTFTTGAAPAVEAATGAPSAITATGALISGTVNPDGQQGTYTFALGVYAGAGTQYGDVFSGSSGAGTVPVAEGLQLTGLQPGVTYAYKIAIHSGYGTAEGAPVTFTTAGLPAVLDAPAAPPLLQAPDIVFPKPAAALKAKGLTRARKLAKALKACRAKVKGRRASCERQARRKLRTGISQKGGAK